MEEIIIEKQEIVDKLHKLSAHIGMKVSAPEMLASTADDEAKIDIMFDAATVELLNVLLPYASVLKSGGRVVYSLDMPVNWKRAQLPALQGFCNDFLLHSLLARWFDFLKNDSAGLYRALNKENAAAIIHLLQLREKPAR